MKKVGRRWSGLCPFHAEKTPSFSVNAEEGFYYCFGCQASGDAITFVRAIDHLDFVDAVRFLADRAGITLHEDQEAGRDHQRRSELLDAMERAVAWYHERLLRSPDAGPARDYLRSRGYDGDIVRQFRLGWAPDDWDALAKALKLSDRRSCRTRASASSTGAGRSQDFFRAPRPVPDLRPLGPARSRSGGASCRRARAQGPPERPEPKYKNSQESPIYSKRRTLYALNWAKQGIIAQGEVVVCEGYTDVIGCFQAGVPWAVATCGTALAEEHFTLLRNFAKRIVLAYDADSAGQSATSRVYEWERKHEVDVVVAELPGGSDPGDLARTDPGALARAIKEARPFLQFRVDRMLGAGDLTTAEGRARAAEAALTAVAEHPDDLVRDQYVMQLADRCRVDAARLRERLDHLRAHPPAGADGPPRQVAARRAAADGVPRGRQRTLRLGRRGRGGRGVGAAPGSGARGAQARGASTRGRGRPRARGALRRPGPARGLHRTARARQRAGRGGNCGARSRRSCCVGSSSKSRWPVTPNWGIPWTPWSSCLCVARRGGRSPRWRSSRARGVTRGKHLRRSPLKWVFGSTNWTNRRRDAMQLTGW